MRASTAARRQPWHAVILAGGDGSRLRPLTTLITGDDRPKQFCAVLGGETLLERTRRRTALAIDAEATTIVLTGPHEPFYGPLLAGTPRERLVVQPVNRGTAPAILYALHRIQREAPRAAVAVIPSDHYVSDDDVFMAHVVAGLDAVEQRPERVVVLGIAPEDAEVEYGWIEPGERLESGRLRRIRRFWEKPAAGLARSLLAGGCLWNSFVMMGCVPALLALVCAAVPELSAAFAAVSEAFDGPGEDEAVRRLYARLAVTSFSDAVLARPAAHLAVLPVHGVRWSDWGHPRRVLATLAGLGIEPEWARRAARLTPQAPSKL